MGSRGRLVVTASRTDVSRRGARRARAGRAWLAAGLLALPLSLRAGEIPETLPASEMPSYVRVSPGLATAGQPSAETLARLKQLGFRTVINLRAPDEPGVQAEAGAVTEQGLAYHLIPVTARTFSSEQVDAVAKILEDPDAAPVLIHCHSSNRVGAVMLVLEARKGLDCASAEAAGRKLGLKSPAMAETALRLGHCPQP